MFTPRSTPPRPFPVSGPAWPPPSDARPRPHPADANPDAPDGRDAAGEASAELPRDVYHEPATMAASRRSRVPAFGALSVAECETLLARHDVGRLAYAHLGHVNIVPIHYVYHDGWLYGRTGPGAKLTALRHHPWVAFEVDEVDDTFEWRSVVVRGAFYLIAREGPAAERARWTAAVTLLRRLVPEALTPADPTPERSTVFRIHVAEVTGRRATRRA